MFGHFQPHLGQLKHLPPLHPLHRHLTQPCLAVLAGVQRVQFPLVRRLHWFQPIASVPLLSPAALPTPHSLALRTRLAQPVTRRWLPAVSAVFAYLVFQHLDPCFQRLDYLGQTLHQRHYCPFSLAVNCLYFFWRRLALFVHALYYSSLPPLVKFAPLLPLSSYPASSLDGHTS